MDARTWYAGVDLERHHTLRDDRIGEGPRLVHANAKQNGQIGEQNYRNRKKMLSMFEAKGCHAAKAMHT
ncbi:MAG: hypothetical protein D6690_00730 [Nitrospirae bacterium]|nr:MAG: hypothetical protein D6690_00730 [Nitrospirota bacterium]